MARPEPRLIEALRSTAQRLESGASYRWTHMGMCNCGHLAQTVTGRRKEELHRMAQEKAGDWSQQVVDYCPTSGFPMDHVITSLLDLGLSQSDLRHLEWLSDRAILRQIPARHRSGSGHYLDRRRRSDVVLYMRTWADQLENQWLMSQSVPAKLPSTPCQAPQVTPSKVTVPVP